MLVPATCSSSARQNRTTNTRVTKSNPTFPRNFFRIFMMATLLTVCRVYISGYVTGRLIIVLVCHPYNYIVTHKRMRSDIFLKLVMILLMPFFNLMLTNLNCEVFLQWRLSWRRMSDCGCCLWIWHYLNKELGRLKMHFRI